jgi:hypothetical protein
MPREVSQPGTPTSRPVRRRPELTILRPCTSRSVISLCSAGRPAIFESPANLLIEDLLKGTDRTWPRIPALRGSHHNLAGVLLSGDQGRLTVGTTHPLALATERDCQPALLHTGAFLPGTCLSRLPARKENVAELAPCGLALQGILQHLTDTPWAVSFRFRQLVQEA